MNQKQVKLNESWSNVLPRFGAGENPGSTILDKLKSIKSFTWHPKQHFIAVAQTGGGEGMDKVSCQSLGVFVEMVLAGKTKQILLQISCLIQIR